MKKYLIALMLLGASSTASADAFLYGGASAGSSSFNDGSGSSYTVHAGTGILPFIGLEAGLTRSGEMDTANNESTEVTTMYVAVKPSIDIGPLQIYAKAGIHGWEETVKNDTLGESKDDGVDITYGAGVEYFVGGPVSFGASYQTYNLGGKELSNVTLNATMHFM
jgi:hypothetical protein